VGRQSLGIADVETVLVHVGHLRAYKNAPLLIDAFRGAQSASRLVVAGSCHPPELEADLRAAAAGSASVDLRPRRLDDQELITLLAAADLVVLPYRETFNSGMALLALSAERPVLLPRTPVYEDLREKVGETWVLLYDGEISSTVLDDAVSSLNSRATATAGPALGPMFDWSIIGERTAEAYRSLAKGRRG
jgi:glycosyltransferase involved in cell wall biosynthesis